MHEKMTDEELSEAKRALHSGDSSEADWSDTWGDTVFAHIAALTAERDEEREHANAASEQAREWLVERDALRERVREVERERDGWRRSATSFREQRDAAEHVSGCPLREEMTSDGVPCACASIVAMTGMAARVVSAPMSECATHPEPTTAEAFLRVLEQRAPPSAEAFAMAREPLTDWQRGRVVGVNNIARALAALSLLERRMGAQTRALQETLKLHHRMPGDVIAQIQSALTDAPPVFTLEEVYKAMERTGIHAPTQRDVVAALNALRK